MKQLGLVFLIFLTNIMGQSYPGCADLSANQFQVSTFNVGNRPISVDFLNNPDGTFDAYFARMNGDVVRRASDGTQKTVGHINTANFAYGGMTSFLFHPDFATNGWVFSLSMINTPGWSGSPTRGAYTVRLSRHNFNPTTDALTNEKVLIDIQQMGVKNLPSSNSMFDRADDMSGVYAYFQNGQMRFDRHGNLYVNLGADHRSHESYVFTAESLYIASSAEARAADTKELFGILRIHPDNSQKGYSIPTGNFREYYEKFFQDNGNASAAQEYSVSANKVAPEIYTKGHRTNWNLKVHPTKDWLIWAEVAVQGSFDEIGIVKNPVFGGYPYFHGNNEFTFKYYGVDRVVDQSGYDRTQNAVLHPASRSDTNAPQNHSVFNEGAIYLPPAFNPQITSQRFQSPRGPMLLTDVGLATSINGGEYQKPYDSWYEISQGEVMTRALPTTDITRTRYQAIMTAGIYHFDLALNNPNKLPPHLDSYIFIMDWAKAFLDISKITEENGIIYADTVKDAKPLLNLSSASRIIDGSFTPEGTLYFTKDNGDVLHLQYTGPCVRIDTNFVGVEKDQKLSHKVSLGNYGLHIKDLGNYEIELFDNLGRSLQTTIIDQLGYHSYQEMFTLPKGKMYLIRVTTPFQNKILKRILR